MSEQTNSDIPWRSEWSQAAGLSSWLDQMRESPIVLMIGDDSTIRDVVGRYLVHGGFRVLTASDGEEAFNRLVSARPDLVLLDSMVSGTDGIALYRRIRQRSDVPVTMVIPKSQETDACIGHGIGVVDYACEPLSPRELVAQVKAVLGRAARSSPVAQSDPIQIGQFRMLPDRRSFDVRDERVELTSCEFALLEHLASHSGQICPHESLLNIISDHAFTSEAGMVSIYLKRLGQKIQNDPERPFVITAVEGVGFKLEPAR